MPDAYALSDLRYVNEATYTSGNEELLVDSAAVPANKFWTILQAVIVSSVAETRSLWFAVYPQSANPYPVTTPESFAANLAIGKNYPMLREGMELKLMPGDRIRAYRDAATAGSVMYLFMRYVESDMPLYEQFEPQLQRAGLRVSSIVRRVVGGSTMAPVGPGGEAGRGGKTNPERK